MYSCLLVMVTSAVAMVLGQWSVISIPIVILACPLYLDLSLINSLINRTYFYTNAVEKNHQKLVMYYAQYSVNRFCFEKCH